MNPKINEAEEKTLNYNKWVKGIADKEFNANKMFVNGIFDKNSSQELNKTQNNNILPYPLQALIATLGNSIVNLKTSLNQLKNLQNSPLLRKETNKPHIDEAFKELSVAAESIQKAIKNIDKVDTFI